MLSDLNASLSSSLNKAECISRLDSNLCQWSPYLGVKNKAFMGSRTEDEFKFCQTRQYGNSFHPIAVGRLCADGETTKVSIVFRMHIMVMLFLFIFVGFFFLMFINMVFAFRIEALPLLLFLLVPLGLVYIGFYRQIPKFKNRIACVLESQ